MNPFVIPRRPAGGHRPLCPWRVDEHARYYVDVDHAAAAFKQFTDEVGAPSDALRYGLLVLVSGGTGCGKTSLIHRCVQWLIERPVPEVGTQVVDLTGDTDTTSVDQRLPIIYERLIDDLWFAQALTDPEHTELRQRLANLPVAYPYLSRLLARRATAALVLLPPTHVSTEIIFYRRVIRRNMVFFAETSEDSVVREYRRAFAASGSAQLIDLRVSGLEVADGWRYVADRLAPHTARAERPTIREDVIRSVMEERSLNHLKMSVRELETTLTAVYAAVQARGADAVELSDFTEYYDDPEAMG